MFALVDQWMLSRKINPTRIARQIQSDTVATTRVIHPDTKSVDDVRADWRYTAASR
jgi:hypothetical protein